MLRVGSQTVDLTTPVVMTIINVTPDSFYAGSRTASASAIAERVRQAAAEGEHRENVHIRFSLHILYQNPKLPHDNLKNTITL